MNLRYLAKMAGIVSLTIGLALGLATIGLTGCRVHVEKDAKGEDKNVQVDTPFGGVHVNTDQTTAADMGLPVYPGAEEVKGDDSQEKVSAFYKKALNRFGDVLTCQGKSPVGKPTVTSEGLTCNDDAKDGKININNNDWKNGLELKAGSRRHQHIVGFEDPKSGKTRFALVALDLPANMDSDDKKD